MRQYAIDAFTDHVFAGNPAAVCVMDKWLDEEKMMAITIENNLSETAFAVKEGEKYHLRWFTPGGEIDLCGHATLGTACAIMSFVDTALTEVTFTTLSGDLTVVRHGDLSEMDFPAYELKSVPVTQAMADAMNGAMPKAAYMGRDLLCVFDDEAVVRNMTVDQEKVRALDGLLLHATAPGKDVDCVSRSFAPQVQCTGGSRLRLRPLPHRTLLGEGAGQGQPGSLSGQPPRRHAVLHPGGRADQDERQGRRILRGGYQHRLTVCKERSDPNGRIQEKFRLRLHAPAHAGEGSGHSGDLPHGGYLPGSGLQLF